MREKYYSLVWYILRFIIIIHSKYFPVSDWFKPAALHQIWKESLPYWINNVKSGAHGKLLNQWCQNYVKSAARCRLLNRWPRKPFGTRWCYIGERKNKERNGETPLRRRKYFEWIIKQLLNSAFVGYEEFCRSRRVLSTSAFSLCR